jgi:predicted lipid-binding transport protein (Tim44 family)
MILGRIVGVIVGVLVGVLIGVLIGVFMRVGIGALMGVLMRALMRVPVPRFPGPPTAALARNPNLNEARRKAAPLSPANFQRVGHPEPRQVLLKLFSLQPQIEQRPDKHVARDPRKSIQVKDPPRGEALLPYGLLPHGLLPRARGYRTLRSAGFRAHTRAG